MLRAGVCINCAEKIAALILESHARALSVEPCSGACREAIELYFSTPAERWHAPLTPLRPRPGSKRIRPLLNSSQMTIFGVGLKVKRYV
jgi:hypothetical protein